VRQLRCVHAARACSVFSSNALAQEKTGEFWVDHQLFGTGLSGSYQQAEVAVFVGKNPWQSHGFSARVRFCATSRPTRTARWS